MLFIPFTFIVALVLIGARAFFNSKGPLPHRLKQLLQKLNQKAANSHQASRTPGASALQATKNGTKTGILKQVHFAEVIATSSGDNPTKQINAHHIAASTKLTGKNGAGRSKTGKLIANEQGKGGNGAGLGKRDDAIPEIEEFDIDSLIDVTTNYSVISKANLVKKQHQQQQLNKKLGRKRHNSEGSKLNYSSEQLFKMLAASCLSKEEVEMAVEMLLNKLESGEAQWNQPKNDPLMKLKNQLRESEAALVTESHNHDQARARLAELKQQLQSEKTLKAQAAEELAGLKRELGEVSASLEKARAEVLNQRSSQHRAEEEKLKLISKLEQENSHLQALMANNSNGDELQRLSHELDEKLDRLHRSERANEGLCKKNQELETRLRNAETQLNEMEAKKRSGDYEACTRIAELESDRVALEKALKNHMARLNEVLAANSILEKSLNDAHVLNSQQDDMIKRLHEERHINEKSLQRALCEMETELRTLHEQLSNKSAISEERHRKQLDQFEKELIDAGQREQKLNGKMRQLRDGLSELFPDLNANVVQTSPDDWVHQYLVALKRLTITVDELRRTNNGNSLNQGNDNDSEHSNRSTPSKRSGIDKSTLTSNANGKSSRVGSPTSNGRSSRGEFDLTDGSISNELRLTDRLTNRN